MQMQNPEYSRQTNVLKMTKDLLINALFYYFLTWLQPFAQRFVVYWLTELNSCLQIWRCSKFVYFSPKFQKVLCLHERFCLVISSLILIRYGVPQGLILRIFVFISNTCSCWHPHVLLILSGTFGQMDKYNFIILFIFWVCGGVIFCHFILLIYWSASFFDILWVHFHVFIRIRSTVAITAQNTSCSWN